MLNFYVENITQINISEKPLPCRYPDLPHHKSNHTIIYENKLEHKKEDPLILTKNCFVRQNYYAQHIFKSTHTQMGKKKKTLFFSSLRAHQTLPNITSSPKWKIIYKLNTCN